MERILLVLDQKENRRLLGEYLTKKYQVVMAETDQSLDEPFDLCILDGPALNRLGEKVQTRKEAEQPIFLAFLLIASRQDVGMVTRHLWQTVDELILTPIERVELQARVEILLQVRRLSLELQAENIERLKKINRALKMLSECNQAVIRATEEMDLLKDVCHIITEVGGYRLAWIGYTEQERPKSVRCVAQATSKKKSPDILDISWVDTELSHGPIDIAIRTSKPTIIRNILTDPRFTSWREAIIQRGYASFIALPIIAEGKTLGALSIYAATTTAFDAEEVKLLTDLANNLAFGIMALRTRVERQLAEKELRQYQDHLEKLVAERTAELEIAKKRAEEADRVKSAFLATMSHELRTPLNSIIGFTGILLQGLAGPLNEEQTKQLRMVQTSARHLLNLINDVLDISKIEAGQLEIASELVNMRQVIEKTVRSVTPLAEKKGLTLSVEVAPEVGVILSDQRRVEQILLNLLNNAIKFTDQGEVHVDSRVSEGWVVTSVSDTGIGIKPEDMDKIFKPFCQIDTGLTREYEGTGLGLSICKRLVELLGGNIWVESEGRGTGTTFRFKLPHGGTR